MAIDAFGPAPQRDAQVIAGEAERDPHQHWTAFDAASADLHVLENRVTGVRWHRELPSDECWCWNGAFPGPRIHATRGRPVLVRFRNSLPILEMHRGYGRPVVAPHLQGAHVGGESDGDPVTGVMPERWRDHLYLERLVGFSEPAGAIEETSGACGLAWHDVISGAGAQNTYRGNVGLQLVFDAQDSGDETDPAPQAWRLPSGVHDVPLVLHDRTFDAHGRGYFDLFDLDGLVGDKVTVNGRIQPFHRVARRKYRFRLFNVGPARDYTLHLSNDQEMVQVAADGAILPAPRKVRELVLGVGASAEVVLDFGAHAGGSELFLLDLSERRPGGLPTGRTLPVTRGAKLLRFDVESRVATPEDPSRVPERFFEPRTIDLAAAAVARTFVIERGEGGWTVNGRPYDPDFMAATPALGSIEAWTFVNRTRGWIFGLELHGGLHDVRARGNGWTLGPVRTRGSVLRLAPDETATVVRRFADFTGVYQARSRHGAEGDQGLAFRWRVVA
jgi:FtsP/CotA-like multicopper oxidase with cupredoxin domain